VALLALAALAGGALGGLAWRRRRRRSPDDGTDPGRALAIEAELQEILAEERAAHAERPPPTHALP